MNTEQVQDVLESLQNTPYVPKVRPTRATAHLPRKYQDRSKPYGNVSPLNETITEQEWLDLKAC